MLYRLRKYRGAIGIFLFVFLFAGIWWNAKYQNGDMVQNIPINEDGSCFLPEILDGQVVSQTFDASTCKLYGVTVSVVTFGKDLAEENEFLIRATLQEQNGTIVEEWNVSSSEIIDNTVYNFVLEEEIDGNTIYQFLLQTEGAEAGSSFSVRMSENDAYEKGELTVNGETTGTDLCFSIEVSNAGFATAFFWIVTVIIAVLLTGCYMLCILWSDKAPEYRFAAVILIIGTIYMILLPPLSSPDENVHFMNANKVANFLTLKPIGIEGGEYLRKEDYVISQRIVKRINATNYYAFYCRGSGFDGTEKNEYTQFNVGQPSWLGWEYVLPGIVIAVCRLLRFDGHLLLLAGAYTNLLLYVVITFFAIRIIPYGKNTLGMISLLPMLASILASYSYDVFNYAFISLFFAMSVNFIHGDKQKISAREWIGYCVTAFLFVPVKIIYVCFLLLVFGIPNERFCNKKQEWLRKCMIFSTTGLSMLIVKLTTIIEVVSRKRPVVESGTKFMSIDEIVHIWANSLVSSSDFYVSSMIGSNLAWLNVQIPDINVMIFGILLVITAISEVPPFDIKDRQRWFYRGVLAACLIGIICMATVIWSDRENGILIGLQGRYFIPYLVFFPWVIQCGMKTKQDVSNHLISYAMYGHVFVFYEIMNHIFIK